MLSKQLLCLFKRCLDDRSDLVIDLGCDVIGIARSVAVITSEEDLMLSLTVNNRA